MSEQKSPEIELGTSIPCAVSDLEATVSALGEKLACVLKADEGKESTESSPPLSGSAIYLRLRAIDSELTTILERVQL